MSDSVFTLVLGIINLCGALACLYEAIQLYREVKGYRK